MAPALASGRGAEGAALRQPDPDLGEGRREGERERVREGGREGGRKREGGGG